MNRTKCTPARHNVRRSCKSPSRKRKKHSAPISYLSHSHYNATIANPGNATNTANAATAQLLLHRLLIFTLPPALGNPSPTAAGFPVEVVVVVAVAGVVTAATGVGVGRMRVAERAEKEALAAWELVA